MRDPLEPQAGDDMPGRCPCDHGWRDAPTALRLKQDAPAEALIVIPCWVCNPKPAERWAGGHYKPDHAAGDCGECVQIHKGRFSTKEK